MNLIKLSAIDSTNTYLKQLAKEGIAKDLTVVITQNQLSGKGQMGNGWVSNEGQSLTFSMLKQFNGVVATDQFMISMLVSLGIANALKKLNVPNISIKWPNDILSAKKKVCGILIENVLDGEFVKYAVIGVGINVNESQFYKLPQASSLYLETGTILNLDEVFEKVTSAVFLNLETIANVKHQEVSEAYEEILFRKDLVSVFENLEGSRFNGIIKGISNIGELLIETENHSLQKIQRKEVKLIY